MPAGAELGIGNFPNHDAITMVTIGATLTCNNTDAPGPPLPPGTHLRQPPPQPTDG